MSNYTHENQQNEDQQVIKIYQKVLDLFFTHGSRSSKKVDYFHNSIKEILEKIFIKPEYEIKLEENISSLNSSGKKKCDIVVFKNKIPYIVFPVKLIMTNYKQNQNNSWENLTGECCQLKWANPTLHIIPLNIFMKQTPYLNNKRLITKFESIEFKEINRI